MTPEEFYAHVTDAAGPDGRLPLPAITGWETFPFEQEGLRAVPLAPPVLPEPARGGEGGRPCTACTNPRAGENGRPGIWTDERWRLSLFGPSGAPLVLLLEPLAHHDLPDLPDDLARELGLLTVRIVRAVESLQHIARAHVSRWGDGGAHLHVFFWARPAGFAQLRGTCLPIWDDVLPPVPELQRETDAMAVAAALVSSYGGTAHAVVAPGA